MKAKLEQHKDALGNPTTELTLIIEQDGMVVAVAEGSVGFLEGYARSYGLDLPTEVANA